MDKSNQAEANSATSTEADDTRHQTPLTQQHQSPHLLKILTSYPESDRLADERCTVMSKNNGHESPLKRKTPQGESQKSVPQTGRAAKRRHTADSGSTPTDNSTAHRSPPVATHKDAEDQATHKEHPRRDTGGLWFLVDKI
ncbi:hypothetical protein Bbelb_110100 [Branchiostoma belcheri]|nr:hypothetical protein Bbelb_110100 [Branchiostoma belcheri]